MTSIFASVRTFLWRQQEGCPTGQADSVGPGPSNLDHTDRRSQHINQARMKNDGRAGDDSTTALAKRWQYAFIQLFTAYIRSLDYAGELSWFPLQTLVRLDF